MKRAFDANPTLIKGGGGIFDVHVDGVLVFSKHQVGRFPDESEVEAIIRKLKNS